MELLRRIRFRGARFARDESGTALLYFALALPVLVGVAGLSVDIGVWHADKRQLQIAADSAAVAGALELLRNGGSQVTQAASLDAQSNGYDMAAGDLMSVNQPPLSGPYAGAGDAVEIVITRPTRSYMSAVLPIRQGDIVARSVAVADINDTCVWALDPDDRAAVKVSGGAEIHLSCGVIANSTDSEALQQSGTGSCITATKIKVAGGYTGDCVAPPPYTNVAPVEDPLSALQPPTYGSCDYTANIKANGGESITLDPGVYCGSITAVSTGILHFNPGLYVLDGAGMNFSAQSTITGTDVTFYLTQNSGSGDSLNIQAGATVTLAADPGGDLPGILFFQDRNAPSNTTHSLTGGANMNLDGIIYFPNQDLNFSGGTSISNSSAMLVANTINFTGQAHLGSFEGSAAQANTALIEANLVE